MHHSVVQSLCNIKRFASDLFKAFGLFLHQGWGGVKSSELLLSTVVKRVEFGRSVEVLGWEFMLELQ